MIFTHFAEPVWSVPTETAVTHVRNPYLVNVDNYKEDLLCNLSLAWKLAAENIQRAQKSQKRYYDRSAKKVELRAGDRVMVYIPSEVRGEEHKLKRPFHGPYRVLSVTDTNVEVRLIDLPTDDPIFVNMNRIRLCHPSQGDVTWTGEKRKRRKKKKGTVAQEQKGSERPVTRSKSKVKKL